tara:strand:+ start:505 stop:636 length:132 start_codon:yes stop_codon:yes gene_type:complete
VVAVIALLSVEISWEEEEEAVAWEDGEKTKDLELKKASHVASE